MTFKILNTETREIVAEGLTLTQAARVCARTRRYVFLPERV